MTKRKAGLPTTAINAVKLSAFAPMVIALRMAKIAAGGAAGKSESGDWCPKKMKAASDAALDAAKTVLTGHPGEVLRTHSRTLPKEGRS